MLESTKVDVDPEETHMPTTRRKVSKYIVAIVAFIVLALGIGLKFCCQETTHSGKDDPGNSWPVHFFLDGYMYVYNGHLSYVLPDGFEYVGDIINVGNLLTGLDFEGNCDGHIYMSKSDQSLVYFCWEEWDEEIDGKEPYLILYKRGDIELLGQ